MSVRAVPPVPAPVSPRRCRGSESLSHPSVSPSRIPNHSVSGFKFQTRKLIMNTQVINDLERYKVVEVNVFTTIVDGYDIDPSPDVRCRR